LTHCEKIGNTTICMIKGKAKTPFFYDRGFRYCEHCERTFLTKRKFCICCGRPLRIYPRGKKGRAELNKRTNGGPVRY